MPCNCEAIEAHFTPARAEQELRRYRRRGPTGTARTLLRLLRRIRIRADTLLDVGAGAGVLHHELLGGEVQSATHVEASTAYLQAARAESGRRGHGARVRFEHGDFLSVAPELAPADLVTLDRVLCCYPGLEPLVRESAAKTRHYWAASFPLDRWYIRLIMGWDNARRAWAGNEFQSFVHPASRIYALLRASGLELRARRRGWFWEVAIWARPDAI